MSFWKGFEKRAIDLEEARKASRKSVLPHVIRTPKDEWASTVPGSHPVIDIPKNVRGKIFIRGDQARLISRDYDHHGYEIPHLSYKEKEMTNRLIVLHEGNELGHIRKKSVNWMSSHADPRVILRESNAVASLKPEFAGTKKFFDILRSSDKTAPTIAEKSRIPIWSTQI